MFHANNAINMTMAAKEVIFTLISLRIKCDSLCINICWPPREVLKPEPERRGFQHLPTCPADVNVSENHVWSLLLHKMLQNVLFSCTYNGAERHVTCNCFENAASRQMITSFWSHKITFATVHITDDDVRFCDGPRILIHKVAKPCNNSTWIVVNTWIYVS